MTHTSTRDELVARLVRAGELEISGESQEEADSYFDTENFAFHGPDGFDSDYAGLTEYFQSIRAAFEDRTIRRGIIVAEGDLIACQTWIEGTFTGPFTHSPVGKLEPNGARVVWDLISMFRFDDRGRLVEEFVQDRQPKLPPPARGRSRLTAPIAAAANPSRPRSARRKLTNVLCNFNSLIEMQVCDLNQTLPGWLAKASKNRSDERLCRRDRYQAAQTLGDEPCVSHA